MPAPIVPIAWTAVRLGALAAVAIMAARHRASMAKDPHQEATLDDVPEGLRFTPHRAEGENGVTGDGRYRRVIRFGPNGPGLEIDAAGFARLRLRRVV